MEFYVSQIVVFVLIFARVTALVVVAPIFGHQSIPPQVKVSLGLFLSFVLHPLASQNVPVIDIQFLSLILFVFREIFAGLVLGFATGLLFAGVKYAGDFIAFDMGLSMASAYDPEFNQQSAITGEFLYLLSLLIFLLVNGHHFILEALQLSYVAAPIGTFAVSGIFAEKLIELSGFIFIIAVKLAAPIVVAMFLGNIALGVLARVMPRMNIFMLAFPFKIGLGLIILMTSVPMMVFVFKKLLIEFQENVVELVRVM